MRKFRIAFLFCILILTGIFAVPAQTVNASLVTGPATKDERYRIGFQDVLTVQVFKHPELEQKVAVSPAGMIMLFRVGKPLVAACKTVGELTTDIEAAYKAAFIRDPQVNIFAEQKSQSIAVIGAVEHAGTYLVTRRYQLLEMLAQAGGPNKEAGSRLIVARTGSNSGCKDGSDPTDKDADVAVMDFKIRDVQEGRATMWMQPGDVISVFDSDIAYVYGNVNKQGVIKIKAPTTLMQAIAAAEGLLPAAKKEKVRILRQVAGNADRSELVYDLNLIDKGKAKDPFLEPNDIVAVSEDRTRAILRGIANSLKTTLPSAVYRIPVP